MKRMFFTALCLLFCLVLTACSTGNSNEKKERVDRSQKIVSEKQDNTQSLEKGKGNYAPSEQRLSSYSAHYEGTVEASASLSNGVQYKLYTDGTLELYGGPLSCQLKNENNLKGKINEIKSLILGEGVSFVGTKACDSLTALTQVSFSTETVEIREYAFSNCSQLREINEWGGVTSIGAYAFSGTALDLILLPPKVTAIGNSAFAECMQLKQVRTSSDSNLERIGSKAFQGCELLDEFIFPLSLITIEDYAFFNCTAMAKVMFPIRIQTIGSHAFENCTMLSSLSFFDDSYQTIDSLPSFLAANMQKESQIIIGDSAFLGCSALSKLVLNVKAIGNHSFSNCTTLSSLDISCESIGTCAFSNCSALSVADVDASTLGTQAFAECTALSSIIINASSIGNQAMKNCSELKNVSLTNANANLGTNIFSGCSLNSLEISAAIIPDACFSGLNVRKIVLTTSVIRIGESAFERCDSLSLISIPSTVTSIGSYAFKDCISLATIQNETAQNVSISKNVSELGRQIFDGCEKLKSLHICAPIIPNGTFSNMPGLETFTISDDVLKIGNRAFENCVALTEVDLREDGKIEILGDEVFSGCISLSKVRLPGSLKQLGSKLFKGCDDNLTKVLFGGSHKAWNSVTRPRDWTGLKNNKFSKLDERWKGGGEYQW